MSRVRLQAAADALPGYSNTAAIRTAGASLALGQPKDAFVDDLFDGEALAFGRCAAGFCRQRRLSKNVNTGL
ncbi:hypothetical protein IMZ48_16360 [Candidatus Bathyarchaeota archaeon]|nr:hypothetical protein [Candidatus Bathyarchaeota archaeon]